MQAVGGAFFRVELGAVDVALLDGAGDGDAILGRSDARVRVVYFGIERIGKRKMPARAKAIKQPHPVGELDIVPAHVRDRQTHVRRNGDHLALDQPQALMGAHLVAFLKQKLIAHADAQKRFARGGLFLDHVRNGGHFLHGVAAGAHTRQNQTPGFPDDRRVAAYRDIRTDIAKRIRDALYIANTIVDDY